MHRPMEPFVEDFLAWEVPAAAATVPQAPTMAEKVALSFSFSAAATNRFRVLVSDATMSDTKEPTI